MGYKQESIGHGRSRRDRPIGRIIAGLRLAKGIKQSDLARRAGITQPALSRIEADQVTPGTDTLKRICAALDITLSDLWRKEILGLAGLQASPKCRIIDDLQRATRLLEDASALLRNPDFERKFDNLDSACLALAEQTIQLRVQFEGRIAEMIQSLRDEK